MLTFTNEEKAFAKAMLHTAATMDSDDFIAYKIIPFKEYARFYNDMFLPKEHEL